MRTTHFELPKLPRSYSQTFSCLCRSPPVSSKYRVLLRHCHHRCRCRRFHLCGTAGKRWRYALFQADGAPFSHLFSPPLLPPAVGSRRGRAEQPPSSPGFYGYLSKHFVRGLDTWWIFQDPPLGPAAPPRCDYEFSERDSPFTSLHRGGPRNVLATRFCLKREFHSRIRLM